MPRSVARNQEICTKRKQGLSCRCVAFATLQYGGPMVGERIRHARVGQQRSLADIANKADISVATLSRVENSKQALDLELFLRLARILKVTPSQLLGEDRDEEAEPLAETLARLPQSERTKLWRDLATAKRQVAIGRSADHVSAQVEELIAQIEVLRTELEVVRKRVRREPRKRARA